MASVNKQSLREEFDALKGRFEALCAEGKTVETVAVAEVAFCEHCGEDPRQVRCGGHERRTQIDIVFEKVVSHVDAEIKHCPQCRLQTRGPFPEAFAGPLQYGSGIKAYVLNLRIAQMLSLKRVQQFVAIQLALSGQLYAEGGE